MRTRTLLMLTLACWLTGGVVLAEGPAAPGLRVYVDPDTGEIVEPPAGGPRVADEPAEAEADDLVEEPALGPGGGAKIDLRGRFRSTTRATVREDGSVTKDCVVDRGSAQ